MSLLRRFTGGLRILLGRGRAEREMSEELEAYLDAAVNEKQRAGMSHDDALRAARVEIGSMEAVKEAIRSVGWEASVESVWQDARFALRQLRRSPALTVVVVLSLALGIGANTAIFSLMDAVMLKSLPVKNPKQLVLLQWATSGSQWPPDPVLSSLHGDMLPTRTGGRTSTSFSYPAFQEFRARNQVFSSLFGFQSADSLNVIIGGHASLASGEMVTGDYFSGLGVSPVVGRTITNGDEKAGAAPVAVVSYGFWQRHFGGSSSALGKTITLNSVPFTLVGVAPPEFFGVQPGSELDIWVPISTQPQILPEWNRAGESWFTERNRWWVVMMGRLRAGVTSQQALAEMKVLFVQSMTAGLKPAPKPQLLPRVQLASASQGINELRQRFSKPLWLLMALVALVLLIACANVANLLLARATTRQKEIAVRLAMGAGRQRLIRQLLTESLLLSFLGGAAGLLFAFWGTHVLLALMASGRDRVSLTVSPDAAILGFAVAVSLFTGVLFGLVPALRATRLDLTPSLKENAGTAGAATGAKSTLSPALVVAQIAVCILLLTAGGLFVGTLENLENQNLGFDQHHLLLFALNPAEAGYKGIRFANFCQQLLSRIQALPGVEAASLSSDGLIGAGMSIHAFVVEGYTPKASGEKESSAWGYDVGPDFFKATGIKLLAGRALGPQDRQSSPNVAVVNQALVRQVFGNANPIGRRFSFGTPKSSKDEFMIVGVAQNAKYEEMRRPAPPTVYVPYQQRLADIESYYIYFEVRTTSDPHLIISTLRRVARSMDDRVPLFDVRTETEKIDQALMQERLFARLSSFFGFLALLLACVGLYGIMNYSVVRRTSEIGIRMALGAQRGSILRFVMQGVAAILAVGATAGVCISIAAVGVLQNMLFGLSARDPITLIVSACVLSAAALLAGYLPARRATKIDPLVALRYE
jgi:predicted permease